MLASAKFLPLGLANFWRRYCQRILDISIHLNIHIYYAADEFVGGSVVSRDLDIEYKHSSEFIYSVRGW